MRLKNFFLFAIIAVTALASCTPQNKDGRDELSIDKTTIDAPIEGGEYSIKLTSTVDWVINDYTEELQSWIEVTPSSGNGSSTAQNVTVKVLENPGAKRSAKITFFGDIICNQQLEINQNGTDPNVPAGPQALTIAEFVKKPVNTTDWYKLTGKITEIQDDYWGNFVIEDGTGSILIYGMTSEKKDKNDNSFAKIGLLVGDTVTLGTLRNEYNGTPQGGGKDIPAYYIMHIVGEGGGNVIATELKSDPVGAWMELPATTNKDLYFIHRKMTVDSKEYRNYSYFYDKDARLAHWVAYPLNETLIGKGSRSEKWTLDPKIPMKYQQILSSGYKGGYQRGHQIPSADRYAGGSNRTTFYYPNATPQKGELNEKAWATLEQMVRDWSKQMDTLYVVTGADLRGTTETAEDNEGTKIPVPVGYYKALLGYKKDASIGKETGGYIGIGFYFEHKGYENSSIMTTQAMTLDALEEKMGMDFFVNLPAAVGEDKAKQVESTKDAWWK